MVLVGRAVRDVELKKTAKNTSIAEVVLAIRPSLASKEDLDTPNYIKCVAFGIVAENMAKNIKKGDLVGIDGSLYTVKASTNLERKFEVLKVKVERFQVFFRNKKTEEVTANSDELTEYTEPTADEEETPF